RAVGPQAQAVVSPGGDGLKRSGRDGRLTERIVAPTVERAVALDGQAMTPAGGNRGKCSARQRRQPSMLFRFRTDLAVLVRAPPRQRPVASNRQTVQRASGNGREAAFRRHTLELQEEPV